MLMISLKYLPLLKSETVTRSPIARHREARPASLFIDSKTRDRRESAACFTSSPIPLPGREGLRGTVRSSKAVCGRKTSPHRFHETRSPGDGIRIARQLTASDSQDCFDIVAMGGDGTLHEVLNGIADPSKVRLGIVPCGSGNDFAAVAGIPASAEGALNVLLSGEARFTDYLECGGIRGINAIGTGIDVEILRRYNRMKLLKGSAAYLSSLVLTLFSYRAKRFSEKRAGETRSHNALIACAGNGRRIGGGIPVCPKAVIDDGLMDIVIVDDIPRRGIPGGFVKLMKGQILNLPTTAFRRDSRLRLESEGPLPIQIDGEIYEGLPFDVRVISQALRVYRP